MRHARFKAVSAVVAASLLVAACGSDDDEDSSDDTTADADADADSGDDDSTGDDSAGDDSTDADSGGDDSAGDDSTGDDSGDDMASGVTVTMWDFGGGGMDTVIAEWEEATGNTVEQVISEFDPHHEKLLAGFVSGEVPDVAVVEVGYSSLFKANPGNFVDLGAECAAADRADTYLPFRWEHGVSGDGTVIGFPTDVGGLAVAYRHDLFEAAGLPSERDAVAERMATWDDFLALGDEYLAATGEPYIDSSGLLFETIIKQGPEGFYATSGEPIYETSDHVAEAWSIATDAIDRGLSANLAGFSPEWNTGMANGDYAVQLAPAWMRTYIKSQAPDTDGLWDITTLPEAGGNWGGAQLTIPANAEHPEVACDLISYLTEPEQELKIYQEFGNFPSAPELYSDPAVVDFTDEFFNSAPAGEIYVDSITNVEPQFEGVDQRTILREFTLALGRVENGEETADEAWQSALDAIALEVEG